MKNKKTEPLTKSLENVKGQKKFKIKESPIFFLKFKEIKIYVNNRRLLNLKINFYHLAFRLLNLSPCKIRTAFSLDIFQG